MPVVILFGPVGERALIKVDGHGLGLTGLEEHLGEALELVLRASHVGLARSHIHLHGFGSVHIGGVGHGGGHGGGVRAGLGDGDTGDLERGVAQAVAERVVDSLAVGVVVAVTDEHALAVVDVAFLARPVQHARVIVDVQRNRLGELAGRADLAEDHIGERRATGLAEQPGFEDALGVLGPRGHGDDGAVGQHDHDVLVRGGDLFEQGDLLGGHVEGFAIEALDSKHPAHDYFADRERRSVTNALNINWSVPDGANVEHVLQAGLSMMDGIQLRWLRSPGRDLNAMWVDCEDVLFPSPLWDGYR